MRLSPYIKLRNEEDRSISNMPIQTNSLIIDTVETESRVLMHH
jgi:hypothetical protein